MDFFIKYIRPKKNTHGHTNVYNSITNDLLGYFMKGNVLEGGYVFITRLNSQWNGETLKFSSRKKLISFLNQI